jgi:GH43 family beta-xylosidase
MLSKPEFDWECRGFLVNEGPAVLFHGDKLFVSYSASATDENYCMGLLWIDVNADPLRPENWHKAPQPVFRTSYENRQYGPDTIALRKRRRGRCAGVPRAELHRN